MRCDVLLWEDVCCRGKTILTAMARAGAAAGVECIITTGRPRGAPLLMSWGLGHVGRRPIIDQHMAAGGHLIGWDLGYWGRGEKGSASQSFRLTINANHPWRMISPESPDRWEAAGITLRDHYNPSGPILLAGLGRKANALYPEWEAGAVLATKARHPGRRVEFRHKIRRGPPIGEALRGKSLVVCRHSNVAVDACIAGIPVECEDGAAFALYRDNPAPTREQRLAFLQSLAWWNWKPEEAVKAWKFLRAKLSA